MTDYTDLIARLREQQDSVMRGLCIQHKADHAVYRAALTAKE